MDPPSSVTGWRHVWVHIPDNGATTFHADYKIQDHPDADPVWARSSRQLCVVKSRIDDLAVTRWRGKGTR